MESVLVSSCSPHLAQAAGQGCSAAGRCAALAKLPPRPATLICMPDDPSVPFASSSCCCCSLLLHATRNMLLLSRPEFFTGVGGITRGRECTVTTTATKVKKTQCIFTHFTRFLFFSFFSVSSLCNESECYSLRLFFSVSPISSSLLIFLRHCDKSYDERSLCRGSLLLFFLASRSSRTKVPTQQVCVELFFFPEKQQN